jgi:methionine-S-sulfoxide reductase
MQKVEPQKNAEAALFAAGCFWGVEERFGTIEGVLETEVGYTGGTTENPTYKDICYKKTGHAEAVRVVYDPSIISYHNLVKIFYKMHDPTTKDRQGPDVGDQYRSAIFYLTEEQESIALSYTEQLDKSNHFPRPIVTEITKASKFFLAEVYHQKYFQKNPDSGCHFSF